ncbi:uncharacterized protein LOC108607322 isoform X2 [Drosophila busckii]|uniref:uncharacterized protein LOC108607322 isoform X2 n=1 Tax=Drosophila busckii TaxID=30019 RepID=UPI001432887A|nr:uncharacterized protein LOC108607322 isoform X2 [Drosophila busckii]
MKPRAPIRKESQRFPLEAASVLSRASQSADDEKTQRSSVNAISTRVQSKHFTFLPTALKQYMPKVRNRSQDPAPYLASVLHRFIMSKKNNELSLESIPFSRISGEQYVNLHDIELFHTSSSTISTNSKPQFQPPNAKAASVFTSLTSRVMKATNRVIVKKHSTRSKSSNCANIDSKRKKPDRPKLLIPLPTFGATSFVTLLTLICIETVLLSTMTNCAKTFYMHWNTSNSIFRIDNTDHIIDVNKGNLAFEFDQVHIICPVYEPGTFENETEKYIIYNVSKVEYETCRITNADPRVIAICDKPQKLMFFTITFRPFTPQPGGLEFLPGNDYYFISTSSKDDLYRRIGGRCSTNNMKVVFKVCCAAEEKNKTMTDTTGPISASAENGIVSVGNNLDSTGVHSDSNLNSHGHGHGHNVANTIGISGVNTGSMGRGVSAGSTNSGIQLKPISGMGTSINTNIDHFNRIPIQPNVMGNSIGASGGGVGGGMNVMSGSGTGGIILSPGHGSINMLPPGRGGVHMAYPGHHHIQTGIRINNVQTQQSNQHPQHKGDSNVNNNDDNGYDKHPNEVVKNEELTYNSGSASAVKYHIGCISIIWPEPFTSHLRCVVLITLVISFHYLFGFKITIG